MELVLRSKIAEAVKVLYGSVIDENSIQLQETRKDFNGDYTFVVFPFIKFSKNTPEKTAEDIGNYLVENLPLIAGFNVVKGFLNLVISNEWWVEFFMEFCNLMIFLHPAG